MKLEVYLHVSLRKGVRICLPRMQLLQEPMANVMPICHKRSCIILSCEVGEESITVLGIVVKVEIACTEGEFAGIYLIVGRTVVRSIYSDVALNVDPAAIDVRTKFSLSSRVVDRPCCRIRYFDMIDSSSPGTYQTSDS